jgi:hypothetical protein
MGWQDAHIAAVLGNPATMWLGTEPPSVAVLFQEDAWQLIQSVELKV